MTMKATFSLLFLILAITCTVIAENKQYQKFMAQHYHFGMTVKDCNNDMNYVNANYNGGECKRFNTFITGQRVDAITAVCHNAGRDFPVKGSTNSYKSTTKFSLIICEYIKGSNPCNYQAYPKTQLIVIACNSGLPVHYHTQLDN
uniref:Ribonuclease A-domain domain-containing protein n=1 Tax=Anguilla anguilla TaxID=7936 RepID=A0A0E9WS31_ANGAN